VFLGGRGAPRRGGAPYEGAGRGGSQRFNKFEGQRPSSSTNESTSFDQGGDAWTTETGTRGSRGRGGPRRGNFEGGYGGGRGGGRGNFNNREGSQQENSGWQQNTE
jgi:regulator of nonsense transcripts 3